MSTMLHMTYDVICNIGDFAQTLRGAALGQLAKQFFVGWDPNTSNNA